MGKRKETEKEGEKKSESLSICLDRGVGGLNVRRGVKYSFVLKKVSINFLLYF
jgi:hypothetical protein